MAKSFAHSRPSPVVALAVLALALTPVAMLVEKSERQTWHERLFLPDFTAEENRHTPFLVGGTFLPPTIMSSQIFTAADSPVIIAGRVTVPAGVTLTLEAGTNLFVHEYGSLQVMGTLDVRGQPGQPVQFSTNELHLANRHWSGIIFLPGGRGRLRHTTIRQASPGITCDQDSHVLIEEAVIELGNVGVFTRSSDCVLTHSLIRHVATGVIAVAIQPAAQTTTIHARDQDIQIHEETR